ncbi:MAG: hypothetical protein OXG37_16545 [Actinomycetia bacterium]|nr:hypothetical protein [Actinomycetes bacterium]
MLATTLAAQLDASPTHGGHSGQPQHRALPADLFELAGPLQFVEYRWDVRLAAPVADSDGGPQSRPRLRR